LKRTARPVSTCSRDNPRYDKIFAENGAAIGEKKRHRNPDQIVQAASIALFNRASRAMATMIGDKGVGHPTMVAPARLRTGKDLGTSACGSAGAAGTTVE